MTELGARLERARSIIQARFGFRDFRPGQFRALRAALAGRSALVVLPTGAGKSLCYQAPALVLDGVTVVVSPLISLMQDQVDALRARGIWAAALTGAQSPAERERILYDVAGGGIKLLYVAPERLAGFGLIPVLRSAGPALLAIDEAHCVSEWGHDFRPAYRRLGWMRMALGRPPTLALTGTATPRVRDDICDVLRLDGIERIVGSFDRPNLVFGARQVRDEAERRRRLLDLLRPFRGAAIVYAPTRRSAEQWARSLHHAGLLVAPYHAGLEAGVRRNVQLEFQADRLEAVVATTAFGLGIDKPDVRSVLHVGLATSLEAYYQEAGRAGRDGRSARCEVLWTMGDLRLQRSIVREPRRLDPLIRYLAGPGCRRARLLRHFGERPAPGFCRGCDRCERSWRRRRWLRLGAWSGAWAQDPLTADRLVAEAGLAREPALPWPGAQRLG